MRPPTRYARSILRLHSGEVLDDGGHGLPGIPLLACSVVNKGRAHRRVLAYRMVRLEVHPGPLDRSKPAKM